MAIIGIRFRMFNNQFSQLESAIQRLVRENQQLNQALLLSQQQLQYKHEELENFQLQAMEQEELQTATAQKLEALLALFPVQA
jgi:DNA repair ATPase RecN